MCWPLLLCPATTVVIEAVILLRWRGGGLWVLRLLGRLLLLVSVGRLLLLLLECRDAVRCLTGIAVATLL